MTARRSPNERLAVLEQKVSHMEAELGRMSAKVDEMHTILLQARGVAAPHRHHGHQFPEFFLAAEAERHFADNFIVHVQDGAISGTLDACQRGSRPIDHCCTPIAAAIARARSLSRRPPMPCRRCGAALRRRG